jgi:ATP-binding cassette subfamily B protein
VIAGVASRAAAIGPGLAWAVRLAWQAHPTALAGLVLLVPFRSLTAAGLALVARQLINAVVDAGRHPDRLLERVAFWLAVGLGLALVEVLVPLVHHYALRRLQGALHIRVTSDVLARAAQLDTAQLEARSTRTLLERARENSSGPPMALITNALVVATETLQSALLLAVLIHIEPLGLVVIGPAALVYLVVEWRSARSRHRAELARLPQRRWGRYLVALMTGDRTATEVRLLGLGRLLTERFRRVTADLEAQERAHLRQRLTAGAVFGSVAALGFYAVFTLVVLGAARGTLTVGDIAVFGAVTARLRMALARLVVGLAGLKEQSLALAVVRDFLDLPVSAAPPAASPAPGPAPAARGWPGLVVEDVWFTYPGAAAPALAGVGFTIAPGEIVALVGPNGAGKTTLAKLILGMHRPAQGRVLLDGREAHAWSAEERRARVALVAQHVAGFEATARDNIAFGDWETLGDRPDAVVEIARRAGVDRLIEGLPRGYDTTLGRQFGEHDLSAGQWQLLAIARALARPASVWILDEPSAHLDEQAEQTVLEHVTARAGGRAVLLITHRARPLAIADRVLRLERGRLVPSGPHPAVPTRPRL